MRACRVCWRGIAVREPPVRRRKRSLSRRAISSADRTLTRAAANSIASGIPSSRRQISTTAGALSGVRENELNTALARSTNSRTASVEPTSANHSVVGSPGRSMADADGGNARDGTCNSVSPRTPRASRLVQTIVKVGQETRRFSTRPATAPMRCSQLSRRMRSDLDRRKSITASNSERPGSSRTPSTRAASLTTRSACPIGASSTSHAPSYRSKIRAATSSISRVFPAPPVPMRLTSRCDPRRSSRSASSASRPTKLVRLVGRLVSFRPAVRIGGKSEASLEPVTWKRRAGESKSLSR